MFSVISLSDTHGITTGWADATTVAEFFATYADLAATERAEFRMLQDGETLAALVPDVLPNGLECVKHMHYADPVAA